MGQEPSTTPVQSLDVATEVPPTDLRRVHRSARLTTEAPAEPLGISARMAWIQTGGAIETVAWLICLILIAIWAIGYLWWPFSNDQGNLAWVGDVIRAGGMPYRDAWDVKGPAVHLLFALISTTFGHNEWGLRLFDLIFVGVGAWSLSRIAEHYAGPRSGRWTVVIYLLWYASLDHHSTAQPDAWAGVMLCAAVALMVTSEHRPSLLSGLGAGVLIAVCTLIKPTYALFMALPLLEGSLHFKAVARVRVANFLGAAILGFVAPIALCIAWFAARGALGAWMDVHLGWVPSSYSQLDAAWLNRIQYLLFFLTTKQFAPAIPLAIGGLAVVRLSRWPRDTALLAIWTVLAVLGVAIQGQFFAYHWHPAQPPLALLAGLGLQRVLAWRRSIGSRSEAGQVLAASILALAIVLMVGATVGPAVHGYRLLRRVTGLTDPVGYDRIEFGPYGHHGGEVTELVAYLRSKSTPEETVLVWGSDAGINYLSGRASPSPFGYVQPLVDPPDSDLRRRYRAEFMHRLESTKPRYVVSLNERVCERAPTTDERKLLGPTEGIMRCLGEVPAVRDYVLSRYTVEHVIGPIEIRRRR